MNQQQVEAIFTAGFEAAVGMFCDKEVLRESVQDISVHIDDDRDIQYHVMVQTRTQTHTSTGGIVNAL